MRPSLRRLASTVLVLASAALARPAAAQWMQEPTGEWVYRTNFATQGVFACGDRFNLRSGSCVAAGNSLTLTNGTAAMTFTFIGAAGIVDARTTRVEVVDVGRIDQTVTGTGPFEMPDVWSDGPAVFTFAFTMNTTLPLPGSTTQRVTFFGVPGGHYLSPSGFSGNWGFPTQTAGAPGGYGLGWGDLLRHSTPDWRLDGTPDGITLRAGVSMAPEPSTWALLGGGLAALGLTARARRRRA